MRDTRVGPGRPLVGPASRAGGDTERLDLGHGTADLSSRRFVPLVGGPDVPLTQREVDLLRLLARQQGRPVPRDELLRQLWGEDDEVPVKTLDGAIVRLRAKVEPVAGEERVLVGSVDGISLCTPETDVHRGALPEPVGKLFGREDLVAEVGKWLTKPGTLCLHGPEGIGKRRIVIEAARVHATDGVVYVALGIGDGLDLVRRHVAMAAGLARTGDENLDDTVREALGRKCVLFHNAERAEEAVLAWIAAVQPGGCVVYTALSPGFQQAGGPVAAPEETPSFTQGPVAMAPQQGDAPGATLLALTALSPQAAADLYLDRSSAAGSAPPAEVVVGLVAALAHHPLAIELAAGWSAVLEPEEIAQRLLGADGAPDGTPRDVVNHVLRSSWSLLTVEEQDALLGAAAIPSAFDRDLVVELSESPARCRAAVLGLRQRALMRPVSEGSAMLELAPAVRAYVQRRMPVRSANANKRFATVVLRRAEALGDLLFDPGELHERSTELATAITWMRAIADADAHAAVVLALGPALDTAMWFEVHANCLDEALALNPSEMLAASLHERRAHVAIQRGHNEAATKAVADAALAVEAVGDEVLRAAVLLDEAALHGLAGDGDAVVARTRQAGDLVRAIDDPRVGPVWRVIGANLLAANDLDGAAEAYTECTRFARAAGAHRQAAAALTRLASITLDRGELPTTSAFLGQAEAELRLVATPRAGSRATPALLRVRAALAELRGDLPLAEADWRAFDERADSSVARHEARLALARCALVRGALDEAADLLTTLVSASRQTWRVGWVEATALLAVVHARRGSLAEVAFLKSELAVAGADEAVSFVDAAICGKVPERPDSGYLMRRLRYRSVA